MPIGDFLRRRPEGQTCQACGSPLPHGAVFCPSCGVKVDDPQAEPLHIVDRITGLFNDRFVRPVLEDELARAHRYQRNLGVLLIEANGAGSPDEALKLMAAALAGTVRDVDTPGVIGRNPPQLLAILPDTDVAGTAHPANRALSSVNGTRKTHGGQDARPRRASVRFEPVCESPMRGGRRTAELGGFASPQSADLLREVDYGDYEGLTSKQIHEANPSWELYMDGSPGGETPTQIYARVQAFIALAGKSGGRVLAFSHGHTLRATGAAWIRADLIVASGLMLDVATLSVLRDDGHRLIALWNSP